MRTALLSAVFAIALSFSADGTDYGKPLPVTRIAGLKRCKAVAVAGEWLYAAGDRSLVIYRIGKNPLVPEETARTPLAGARQIAVSERFLFVSARHSFSTAAIRHARSRSQESIRSNWLRESPWRAMCCLSPCGFTEWN